MTRPSTHILRLLRWGRTLARHGASVTLFDCDPNRNLVAWKDGPSQCPITVTGHGDSTNIGRTLRGEGGRSQFVIADLEGTASLMVASAVLDGISAELQASGVDIGGAEELAAEELPEALPEAPVEAAPAEAQPQA